MREQLIARMEEARARTMLLLEPLSDEDLHAQHDPLMSPIIWDLGHIAHFEELWLLKNLDGPVEFGEMPGIYNPFEHPRRERGELQLPSLSECRTMMEEIRSRVLQRMSAVDFDSANPLLHDGYVYSMVLQHEYQHNETILQTLQLKRGEPYRAPRAYALPVPRSSTETTRMVRFTGGRVWVGTDDRSAAYDNERPVHELELAPFSMDVFPVTNGEFAEFIRASGYSRSELWSAAGWAWVTESKVDAPKYWLRDGDNWCGRSMDNVALVNPSLPVCHVCFYEAEAFARYVGKRLPTEQEWEVAAGWDPFLGRTRVFPWGDSEPTPQQANVDQLAFSTAPIGAYTQNWSPLGCYGMIGDVWEWTSSDFRPYPRYETFPYPEYSELFFGSEYKVLRGGSWATRPGAIRNSFRNWDYPIRRQIFSGFRCASDD
ncbi:MAG TPA: ergothioneine biosynthesis protein EgtB [Gemmatimonadaceae bacterium]|nr:ergothioneine biosynthesis protein EgtB [Gemmatimonadaceae bacterium]